MYIFRSQNVTIFIKRGQIRIQIDNLLLKKFTKWFTPKQKLSQVD